MEIREFRKSLAAGMVEIKRYGESFNIVKRQFSPDDGTELAPSIGTITRAEVLRVRDDAQKTLDEANAMLAEIDKLIVNV